MQVNIQGYLVNTKNIIRLGPILDYHSLTGGYMGTFGFWVYVFNDNNILVHDNTSVDIPTVSLTELHSKLTKFILGKQKVIPTFCLDNYLDENGDKNKYNTYIK